MAGIWPQSCPVTRTAFTPDPLRTGGGGGYTPDVADSSTAHALPLGGGLRKPVWGCHALVERNALHRSLAAAITEKDRGRADEPSKQ